MSSMISHVTVVTCLVVCYSHLTLSWEKARNIFSCSLLYPQHPSGCRKLFGEMEKLCNQLIKYCHHQLGLSSSEYLGQYSFHYFLLPSLGGSDLYLKGLTNIFCFLT